jgi:hypothetical protein
MIHRLSRSYTSIEGAPTLERVDDEIFRLSYFARCMDCSFCHDACCSYGVDVDEPNVARILAHREALEARLGIPASEWFEPERARDADFPGGHFTRTRVRDGKCVFFRRSGRGCELHAFSLENGLAYQSLKPFVSSLFPLTFDAGLLRASSEARDRTLVCTTSGTALVDGVRSDLAHYFGAALVAELDHLRATSGPLSLGTESTGRGG